MHVVGFCSPKSVPCSLDGPQQKVLTLFTPTMNVMLSVFLARRWTGGYLKPLNRAMPLIQRKERILAE